MTFIRLKALQLILQGLFGVNCYVSAIFGGSFESFAGI
jgi:hypothetical protein